MAKSFLYFAYGSNLLSQRILINNPTAIRKSIAKLENYRLDFGFPFSPRWGGCPATIVPYEGEHVWGAVWEISECNKADLDRQEGVEAGIYISLQVEVETEKREKLTCRSYQLCSTLTGLEHGECLPKERLPSEIYLAVILKGAEESQLPKSYIEKLQNIPHNGSKGGDDVPIKFPLNI
ncbi:Gamma-glutamylcyclotransferase [Blattella germanica]|nr:Gamma-glutamylcyclotransferase [Blattella germanica]